MSLSPFPVVRRKLQLVLALQTLRPSSMDLPYGPVPWTSSMDQLHGPHLRTSSMDLPYGPVPWTSPTDQLHGPPLQTSSMDLPYGPVPWTSTTDQFHGPPLRTTPSGSPLKLLYFTRDVLCKMIAPELIIRRTFNECFW